MFAGGFYKIDILIPVGCAAGLSLFLLVLICCICTRRIQLRRERLARENALEIKSNVEFTYNKEIEAQQSPLFHVVRSCPPTPLTLQKQHPFWSDPAALRRNSLNPHMLNIDLYGAERGDQEKCFYNGLGRLCFGVSYTAQDEQLKVKVVKAELLRTKSGALSPYVKVCVLPDKKRRVHTKTRKGENPLFNEEFSFQLKEEEVEKRVIRFTVCDFDRFSRQQVIGYVVVSLAKELGLALLKEGSCEIWRELVDSDSLLGEEKGDLLISLSHLPTSSRLTLVILQAKDLHVQEELDNGVNVKIYLVHSGKLAKSRKTTVRKVDLSNPIFNETFVFDIPAKLLERISLVMMAFAHGSGEKRLIGKTTVGPAMFASGLGLSHWNDMLASPRVAVTHWHKLV